MIERHHLPFAAPGQRIGLLGGSFDPPHAGHVHITKEALKRFSLDRVWWLVSPGNPLKPNPPRPMQDRIKTASDITAHPRVSITGIEEQLGTRFTADTLQKITVLYPRVQFVWLMGADNLADLHHWQNWQDIMCSMPMGILARPGDRLSARTSTAAQVFRRAKLSKSASHSLGSRRAPQWCFVNVPMRNESSTAIRLASQ